VGATATVSAYGRLHLRQIYPDSRSHPQPYMNERFPTEIRATASAFCYHQAAIFGGFVPLVLTMLAERLDTGLAEPMIIGTWIGCIAWAAAAFFGPETKGKVLVPDLVVA